MSHSKVSIAVREFDYSKDKDAVVELLYDTWFDDIANKLVGRLCSLHYFLHDLLLGNQAFVAYREDTQQVVGFAHSHIKSAALSVAARARFEPNLGSNISKLWHSSLSKFLGLVLCFLPSAQDARLFDDLFFANYAKLRRLAPQQTTPELVLLIVNPELKGCGIGKQLISHFENYCLTLGYKDYFLLTDSSCDYQVYDHLGMERIVDIKLAFQIHHVPEYAYYLNGYLRGYVYRQALRGTERAKQAEDKEEGAELTAQVAEVSSDITPVTPTTQSVQA